MLLEREVIFKEDLIEIFGPRPFPDVEDGQTSDTQSKPALSALPTSESEEATGEAKTDASDAQADLPAEDSSSASPSEPSRGQPS